MDCDTPHDWTRLNFNGQLSLTGQLSLSGELSLIGQLSFAFTSGRPFYTLSCREVEKWAFVVNLIGQLSLSGQ
jgi:hypothetical protein